MRDGAALSTWVIVVCEERGPRVGPGEGTAAAAAVTTVPAAASQRWSCRL